MSSGPGGTGAPATETQGLCHLRPQAHAARPRRHRDQQARPAVEKPDSQAGVPVQGARSSRPHLRRTSWKQRLILRPPVLNPPTLSHQENSFHSVKEPKAERTVRCRSTKCYSPHCPSESDAGIVGWGPGSCKASRFDEEALWCVHTHTHPNYGDHRNEKPLNLIKNQEENGILSEMKKRNFICQCLGFS